MDFFDEKENIYWAIGYVVWMLLVFFIGIPKVSFGTFILGFIVATALYLAGRAVAKKILGK